MLVRRPWLQMRLDCECLKLEDDRYDLNAMYVCSLQIRTGVLIDDYKYKRIGDHESVDCEKACYDARKVSNCVSCQSPKLGFRGNVLKSRSSNIVLVRDNKHAMLND